MLKMYDTTQRAGKKIKKKVKYEIPIGLERVKYCHKMNVIFSPQKIF